MPRDTFDPQAARNAERSEALSKLESIISQFAEEFNRLDSQQRAACFKISEEWLPKIEELEESDMDEEDLMEAEAQQEENILKELEIYFPFVAGISEQEKMDYVSGFFSFIERKKEAN